MAAQPWSSADIALALNVKGWTMRRLAEDLGMSPSEVAYGPRKGSSLRLRERVASILPIDWTILWPERCPPQWGEGDLSLEWIEDGLPPVLGYCLGKEPSQWIPSIKVTPLRGLGKVCTISFFLGGISLEEEGDPRSTKALLSMNRKRLIIPTRFVE